MTSTILSACVKCGDLPTSIVMFSADDYASCAAAFLCKNCAPTVAHNAASVGELRRKGWRVGTTKMKGRPRHLETDPRWKHKPNLQHELIRFYMTHMSHVSAKHMAKRLPQFLLDKIVTQFINSSSRLSSNCARVLRETAFKRTPEVNLRDMGMNDSDMKLVAYFATRDSHVTHTLDVSWNRMGRRGAKSMATALLLVRNLRTLNLSWTLFADAGMRLLEDGISRNVSLTSINLAGCRLSAHAAPSIARVLAQNTTLLDLNLGFNDLRRVGSTRVAHGLERNRTLTRLSLRSNKLGREGAVAIAKALTGNMVMFHVNVADNNIGELGAQAMASLTSLKTVELVRGIMPNFDEQQAKKAARAAEELAKKTELALVAALERVGSLDNVHEYGTEGGDVGSVGSVGHESKGSVDTGLGSDGGASQAAAGAASARVTTAAAPPLVPRLRLSERDLDEAARRVAQQRAARRKARSTSNVLGAAGAASTSGRVTERSSGSGDGSRSSSKHDGVDGTGPAYGAREDLGANAEDEAAIRAAADALISGRSYDPGVGAA